MRGTGLVGLKRNFVSEQMHLYMRLPSSLRFLPVQADRANPVAAPERTCRN
jgi:hypothetical protein